MGISVHTIHRTSPVWHSIVRMMKKFAAEESKGTKLEENYTTNMKEDEWLALSYYEDECKILGFSSVVYRDIWNGSARIVNRMLKSREYRFASTSGEMTEHTTQMLKQQIAFCRDNGFDNAFMSRESNSSKAAFMRYLKNMQFTEWHIPEGRYMTCTSDVADCWQHVMYTPLKKESQFNLQHITEEQYNEKFKTTDRLRGI